MNTPDQLHLDEKAALSSGEDFWNSKAVRDIPSVLFSDGPHGLRKQGAAADHLGVAMSLTSTCFPPASGLSQSWNEDLIRRVGAALGQEARAEEVDVLLGPGVNIKRHPLNGRNFEYFSEDPQLAGSLGVAWVEGIQSQGVGASVKHFAANNQETDRHRISAEIDSRTLREIYLRAFQQIVQVAKPWTVMCSYNAVNGTPVSQNTFLLTDVLRDDWGFDGVVVSDWGAISNRVESARAGVDLEMPASGTDAELIEAVQANVLDESVLDRIATRVSTLAFTAQAARGIASPADLEANHALAQEAARQSIVLLKNEGQILPLASTTSVAVIGEAAVSPRFQGGGSSFVNAAQVDIPLVELKRVGRDITYAPGYTTTGSAPAAELIQEAVAAASEADAAVVFLAADVESEGFDREDLDLPADQLAVLEAVLAVNPRTVVVLARGGVVQLSPLHSVPAILDGALLGEGIGRAIAEVIFGIANPSGRLSETIPERLEDTPAFGNFPGEHGRVLYGEGHLVGYRWYDARKLPVAYAFGHGLSYTTFAYTNLTASASDAGIKVTVTVTNTGDRRGREVPQFYVSVPNSEVARAPKELKGFASVELDAGESVTVSVLLRREDLTYWDIRGATWTLEGGLYVVSVGASSRDLRGESTVDVTGDRVAVNLTLHSTIGELLANPVTTRAMSEALTNAFGGGQNAAVGGDVVKMISPSPLVSVIGLLGAFDVPEFELLLLAANTAEAPAPI